MSCAPTNDYIIKEGQGQIDWCFSERLKCKSAQMLPTQFLVWRFDEFSHNFERLENDSLHIHLPIFLRVRVLDIHTVLGKKSLSAHVRNGRDVDILVNACSVCLIMENLVPMKCLISA